jgi:hypothetical protein
MLEPAAAAIGRDEPGVDVVGVGEELGLDRVDVGEVADQGDDLQLPRAREVDDLRGRSGVAHREALHATFGDRGQDVVEGVQAPHAVERARKSAVVKGCGHGLPVPGGAGVQTSVGAPLATETWSMYTRGGAPGGSPGIASLACSRSPGVAVLFLILSAKPVRHHSVSWLR